MGIIIRFLVWTLLLVGSSQAQMMQAIVNGGPHAPWTIVASTKCQFTSGSSGCTTPAINTTGANLIVFGVGYSSSSTGNTFSDSASNNWTHRSNLIATNAPYHDQHYVISPTTSATHTFTFAATLGYASVVIVAIKDTIGTPAFEGAPAYCVTSSTSLASTPFTPSHNNTITISTLGYNQTSAVSISPGSVDLQQINNVNAYGGAAADFEQGAAASVNIIWTLPASSDACSVYGVFDP